MGLSGCLRCPTAALTAATPTIRRDCAVRRFRGPNVRCSSLKRPARFSSSWTVNALDLPINCAPRTLALQCRCQATQWERGDVSDPADNADEAELPVGTFVKQGPGAYWKMLLWHTLHSDDDIGQFACSSRLEKALPYPDITVTGVGKLSLPLSREQGLALKAVAEQAPHGRGPETVVDTSVRDALQVDASKVAIGSNWQPTLQSIVSKVIEALDLQDTDDGHLEARLYKLLLYEEGGHFVAHQDTEKESGMLATLVVQLPCSEGHTGGRLILRHRGTTFTHCFDVKSATKLHYAAFFTDCEHELSPITSGMRLTLVYNLVWVTTPNVLHSTETSPAEDLSWQHRNIEQALQAWEESIMAGGEQTRIAFMLDHQYSEYGLDFEYLKGRDRAKWHALEAVEGLEAHLALVSWRIRGHDGCGDEYDLHRSVYWSDSDDEWDSYYDSVDYREDNYIDKRLDPTKWDYVMKELITAEKWVARDGKSAVDYGNIKKDEFFYPYPNKHMFPLRFLREHLSPYNYLGNDGASSIQVYKRVALVLWPRSQTLVNAKKAGFRALLPLLDQTLRSASAGVTSARVLAALVLDECVLRLEAYLPTRREVCDEEPEYAEKRDYVNSIYIDYMNEDRGKGQDIQVCTLTAFQLGIKAADGDISNAPEALMRMAAALEQRPDNYAVLKTLLQCPKVQAAVSMPAIQQLVSRQIANLERMSWIPLFSWNMPEAKLINHKVSDKDKVTINEFLRGPEESLTLSGFHSLREAESLAWSLQFEYGGYSINEPTYSFTAAASKTWWEAGRLTITKTKDWYTRQVEAKLILKQELEDVLAMRR